MKKLATISTMIGMVLSLSAYGAGTIVINNLANTGVYGGNGGTAFDGTDPGTVYSSGVTANGLIFTLDPVAQAQSFNGGPTPSALIGEDFNWALYGGATAGTATTFIDGETGAQTANINLNWGMIDEQSGISFSVPGTTDGTTVYLDLYVWEGSYTSYASALGNTYAGTTGVFANASGGIVSGSPVGASALTGMPDVELTTVPEPATMALVGLGSLSLMLFRRKNS